MSKTRTPREREPRDLAAMMRRMIRALGRRFDGGDADVPDLAEFARLREAVDAAERDAVRALRERYGYSWAEIAHPLGVTRQAAQMRFGGRSTREDVTAVTSEPLAS